MFPLPEVASNAALSPEDQKKRMMIQMLQKQKPATSSSPGGFEIGAGIVNGAASGLMQGKMMQKAMNPVMPGTAANGGWTTQVQTPGLWSQLFGG